MYAAIPSGIGLILPEFGYFYPNSRGNGLIRYNRVISITGLDVIRLNITNRSGCGDADVFNVV